MSHILLILYQAHTTVSCNDGELVQLVGLVVKLPCHTDVPGELTDHEGTWLAREAVADLTIHPTVWVCRIHLQTYKTIAVTMLINNLYRTKT